MVRLALLCLALVVLTLACGVERTEPIACETAGDCNIDEACRDGQCIPLEEAGEGEGEGEGEPGFAEVCGKFAACAAADVNECISALEQERQQLQSGGTAVCLEAVAAHEDAYQCLMGVTCQQLNDGTWFDFCGGQFDLASQLRDQCLFGSGEGEGEGEGEPGCFEAQALPEGEPDAPSLAIFVAERNPAFDEECGGAAGVGLVLEVFTDVMQPLDGVASFNGETVVELQSIRAEDDFVISAVACSDEPEPFGIAVTVFGADFTTLPACATVQRLEGMPTP